MQEVVDAQPAAHAAEAPERQRGPEVHEVEGGEGVEARGAEDAERRAQARELVHAQAASNATASVYAQT